MEIIYGGSFNPPTIAHYRVAKYITTKYKDATFEFLPSNNFYKSDNQNDFYHRVQMLELVCTKLNNVPKVNGFELGLNKYYGTSYTLKHFKGAYFLMGADNLASIETWIDYPSVVLNNKFIIMPRDNLDLDKIINENIILRENINNFLIEDDFTSLYISSTMYRETLREEYLIEEVAKYIKENNLYKE